VTSTDQPGTEEWVIWNGSLGILDMVRIGHVEHGESGRSAFLAPPYDIVRPFSLDELETRGRIAFGECLVMSRRRWQEDQVGLRLEAREKRRAFLFAPDFEDSEHREVLDLPTDSKLEPSEIKAAFRRLAKTAHPDAGGSSEHYRRIVEARDVLLGEFAGRT
jgi:DnaJ domain